MKLRRLQANPGYRRAPDGRVRVAHLAVFVQAIKNRQHGAAAAASRGVTRRIQQSIQRCCTCVATRGGARDTLPVSEHPVHIMLGQFLGQDASWGRRGGVCRVCQRRGRNKGTTGGMVAW